MNATMPVWIVVAQWVLLFGLGLLVITLYRQLAYFDGLRGGGVPSWGLDRGKQAPTFQYFRTTASGEQSFQFLPTGQWHFLMFADPHCGGCERGLAALAELRIERQSSFPRILLVTNTPPSIVDGLSVFSPFRGEVASVADDQALDLFAVRRTPFAFVIDPDGKVRAKGMAEKRSAIVDLLRIADRNGAVRRHSLQEAQIGHQ